MDAYEIAMHLTIKFMEKTRDNISRKDPSLTPEKLCEIYKKFFEAARGQGEVAAG